jgi:hypothetical protein
VLACLDGYMNIAMEQTEEYVNGQLKNKYGDCFIRGNNGGCCRSVGRGTGGLAATPVSVGRLVSRCLEGWAAAMCRRALCVVSLYGCL